MINRDRSREMETNATYNHALLTCKSELLTRVQNRGQRHPIQLNTVFRCRPGDVQRSVPLRRLFARGQYRAECHRVRLGCDDTAIVVMNKFIFIFGQGR